LQIVLQRGNYQPGQFFFSPTAESRVNNLRSQLFTCPHVKDAEKFTYPSGKKQSEIVNITQKPLAFWERLLSSHTQRGDQVFDGTGGSGGLAFAAVCHGRNIFVFEKDEDQCEFIRTKLACIAAERRELLAGAMLYTPEEAATCLSHVQNVNPSIFSDTRYQGIKTEEMALFSAALRVPSPFVQQPPLVQKRLVSDALLCVHMYEPV
jgi:hypothetical protein